MNVRLVLVGVKAFLFQILLYIHRRTTTIASGGDCLSVSKVAYVATCEHAFCASCGSMVVPM